MWCWTRVVVGPVILSLLVEGVYWSVLAKQPKIGGGALLISAI